jgi:hypothetical protein
MRAHQLTFIGAAVGADLLLIVFCGIAAGLWSIAGLEHLAYVPMGVTAFIGFLIGAGMGGLVGELLERRG